MSTENRDGDGENGRFGWLYGQPEAPEPHPEATRMMPVQPEPAPAPPPPPATQPRHVPHARVAPQPGPPQPGPPQPGPPPPQRRPSRGGGFWARRLRRPRFYIRTVFLVLLLWVGYTVAVPFITWSSNDQVAFEPSGERPAEQDGTTYLLVGSDSRKGLTAEERREYSTGNPTSELTDTIMVLHTGSGPSVLLSIPRDSIVDRPGHGEGKINAAYALGGPQLLVQTVENATGIRIDKYVEIGLGGVADVVDAVGGIEVCPRERLRDKDAGLNIRKGCQEVDGATALGYSRSRKVSALGDLERVRRQREVVAAIGHQVLSPWTVINPVRWWRLNKAVPTFFQFGEGTSKLDASRWAYAMTKVELTCTMPVTDATANTWNRDLADPMFAAIIDDDTDQITEEQCTPNGVPVSR